MKSKSKMGKMTKGDGYKPSGKTIMPEKDKMESRAEYMAQMLKGKAKKK